MKLNMFRATPPIIRSPRLHHQPLALHTWKVVGRAVAGRCQDIYIYIYIIFTEFRALVCSILCVISSFRRKIDSTALSWIIMQRVLAIP